MKTLLILDSLRGEDSTGTAFVSKFQQEVTVAKQLGDPFNLFNDAKFAKAQNRTNSVMLGHNRYATSGGVSKAGAHPFDFDTLVGVHNGTLSARYRLDDDKDFKVDSEALYHNIEKNGLKETIRRLGGQGNAWSLVWWNKEEKTLNFLRNEERTMFMCTSEDQKALFWASEYWMLDVALMRHNIKRGEILATKPHAHLSINIDNKGVLGKPHVVEVKPDPIVVPVVVQKPHQNPPYIPKGGTNLTKQVSNVVQMPTQQETRKEEGNAKKFEVANPSGLASNICYIDAGIKRKLEILMGRIDGNGQRYLSLFDPKEPCVDIRLYPCKQDEILFELEGSDIEAAITSFEKTDPKAMRSYYKCSPWTVQYELPEGQPEEKDTVMDHHGSLITEAEWKQRYSQCAWCTSNLRPKDANRYTRDGDCLCPSCAEDETITSVVTLI